MAAVGGGIAVDGRHNIDPEGRADRRIGLQRCFVGLPDQFRRDVRVIEPLADAVHHGRFQSVVVQDG